jgi:hypothetical protein
VISPAHATELLGGKQVLIDLNPDNALLNECALTSGEHEALNEALGLTLAEAARRSTLPDLVTLLFALHALGVLKATRLPESNSSYTALPRVPSPRLPSQLGPAVPQRAIAPQLSQDAAQRENAQRARIAARRALVDQGDYFAVLGVSPAATLHDIERAYQSLRSEFEPSRAITAHTVDLADDVSAIVEVLDEAYAILQDTPRREAYRRAIAGFILPQ